MAAINSVRVKRAGVRNTARNSTLMKNQASQSLMCQEHRYTGARKIIDRKTRNKKTKFNKIRGLRQMKQEDENPTSVNIRTLEFRANEAATMQMWAKVRDSITRRTGQNQAHNGQNFQRPEEKVQESEAKRHTSYQYTRPQMGKQMRNTYTATRRKFLSFYLCCI
jgi:hypothetical protein